MHIMRQGAQRQVAAPRHPVHSWCLISTIFATQEAARGGGQSWGGCDVGEVPPLPCPRCPQVMHEVNPIPWGEIWEGTLGLGLGLRPSSS